MTSPPHSPALFLEPFAAPPPEPSDEETIRRRMEPILTELGAWRRQRTGFLGLPFCLEELEKVHYWAKRIRERALRLVVFGLGGSSLGGEMLVSALGGDGLSVRFVDNVDPDAMAEVALIDWRESFLLVISKSGGTLETLAQFLTTLPDLHHQLGRRLADHAAVITDHPETPMGRIAAWHGIPVIPHPAVGGRFSALSVVGLLPAAAAGVAVDELIHAAALQAEACARPVLEENPGAAMGADLYRWLQQGRTTAVWWHYGDRLAQVAAWYAQLSAESLGKRTGGAGEGTGRCVGLTPIVARGTTDQHSQLQLHLDGPPDKQFTFLYDPRLALKGRGIPPLPEGFSAVEEPALWASCAPLRGQTTGRLFEAEFLGVRESLAVSGAPVRTFHLPEGGVAALGELIVLLETETVVAGRLLGVDPFDQPAVEDGKQRAKRRLLASGAT
ncbi:MAG: hypothetical protein HQL51_03320 [Magnetococcales bacterium]|nr:hypothetical protein [Magnetococcales bacterium]